MVVDDGIFRSLLIGGACGILHCEGYAIGGNGRIVFGDDFLRWDIEDLLHHIQLSANKSTKGMIRLRPGSLYWYSSKSALSYNYTLAVRFWHKIADDGQYNKSHKNVKTRKTCHRNHYSSCITLHMGIEARHLNALLKYCAKGWKLRLGHYIVLHAIMSLPLFIQNTPTTFWPLPLALRTEANVLRLLPLTIEGGAADLLALSLWSLKTIKWSAIFQWLH